MSAMRTPLCDLLGIEHPLIQAPIGSASSPALAAAVANAGGLGMLALSWTAPERIGAVLDAVRELTDRPVGVNILLEWPPEARLKAALAAGARVISLAWGDPTPYVERIHAAGALVLSTVGSPA